MTELPFGTHLFTNFVLRMNCLIRPKDDENGCSSLLHRVRQRSLNSYKESVLIVGKSQFLYVIIEGDTKNITMRNEFNCPINL